MKSCRKEMAITSRLEMEKFNGTNFELWNLKMEDILVNQYLLVVVFGTKLFLYESWRVRGVGEKSENPY
jgi:hypothetical protein